MRDNAGRRGAGVAERAGIENRSPGNGTVGSNPTPSANVSMGSERLPSLSKLEKSVSVTGIVTFSLKGLPTKS